MGGERAELRSDPSIQETSSSSQEWKEIATLVPGHTVPTQLINHSDISKTKKQSKTERLARPTDTSNVRIGKEGPIPGYTGHVPGVKCHVIGHSFSEASKRGVAIAETLRHNELARSIHLGSENRVNQQEQDFYAELSRPMGGGPGEARGAGQQMDGHARALRWRSSKRDAPPETRYASGKVDLNSFRQCIGMDCNAARAAEVSRHMSLGALPYEDPEMVLRKEWETPGLEYQAVNQGKHHIAGYTGHTHAEQHIFGKTYGQTTRELRQFPAEPSTSAKYIDYAQNQPLVINEYELKHPKQLAHNILLQEGEGTLGPLSIKKPPLNNQ